jgi:hypothetical protein
MGFPNRSTPSCPQSRSWTHSLRSRCFDYHRANGCRGAGSTHGRPCVLNSVHTAYTTTLAWLVPTHLFVIRLVRLPGPFFTRTPLHGHGDFEALDQFPLRDVFVANHLDVGSATGLASIRDGERYGGERFVLRNNGAITIGLLSHAREAPGDLRSQHWWLNPSCCLPPPSRLPLRPLAYFSSSRAGKLDKRRCQPKVG